MSTTIVKTTRNILAAGLILTSASCGSDEKKADTTPISGDPISEENYIEDTTKAGIANFIGQEIYKKWTAT